MPRPHQRGAPRRDPESGGGGGWEIVYSGFALILLCFFIMLASFSTMEKRKILSFVRSFSQAVSILPGGIGFEPGPAVMPEGEPLDQNGKTMDDLASELTRYAEEKGMADQVSIERAEKGLVMRFSDTAVFALGEAEISPKALPLLDDVGQLLRRTDYGVQIEGHTDDLPIRTRRFPSNWELSTARAVSVLRYFIENHGIPASRLSAAGFSQFQPVAPNADSRGRAKNRRVEIVLSAQPHGPTKRSS